MRSKTAVIGLGNRLLADEGAGLHAIDLLKEKLEKNKISANVDLIEAGTPGMNLLHQFDEREKIIFIDAGNCGLKAGNYRRILPEEVITRKKTKGYSLHEFDLIRFLEVARSINKMERIEVVIYCLQIDEIALSEKLSPVVDKALPFLVEEVYNEVKNERDKRRQKSPGHHGP